MDNDDVTLVAGEHLDDYDAYRPTFCSDTLTRNEMYEIVEELDVLCDEFCSFIDKMRRSVKKYGGGKKVGEELRNDLTSHLNECYQHLEKRFKIYDTRLTLLQRMYEYLEDFRDEKAEAYFKAVPHMEGGGLKKRFFKETYGVGFGENRETAILVTLYRYLPFFEDFGNVVSDMPQPLHVHFQSGGDHVEIEVKKISEKGQRSKSFTFDNEVEKEFLEEELDEAKEYLEKV